jgi:Fe-S-cluster containining protein
MSNDSSDSSHSEKVLAGELFCCTRCGFCCQGETTVSLNDDDQKRMLAALAISREEAEKQYWRVTGSTVQMKTVDGHCIFHRRHGCEIHHARPTRCAQWPLIEQLADPDNFAIISSSCPGLNKSLPHALFCRYFDCRNKSGRDE